MRPPARPAVRVAVVSAALLALLAAAVALASLRLNHSNPGWMYDARVYQRAGAAVLQGYPVYTDRPPAFTYAPFAGLVFTVLAPLPVDVIGVLTIAVSVGSLILSLWLCLGCPRPARPAPLVAFLAAAAVGALALDPVAETLLLGQVNLVLMALVLIDFALPDGSRLKGSGIGLAAGIKLLPGFFVLYLLVTGRARAAATAVAVFAVTALVALVAIPADALAYWGGVFLRSDRVGQPQNVRSQSLLSLLTRWSHEAHVSRPLWMGLGLLVAVATLFLARLAHRRGEELLAVCVCATATLLLSPITWQHHWVWVVPILVWLGRRALRLRSPAAAGLAALIALDFTARPYLWGIPVDAVIDLHLGAARLLLSSTYFAAAIAFLAYAAVVVWRSPAQPAAGPRSDWTFHQTSTPSVRSGGRPSTSVR